MTLNIENEIIKIYETWLMEKYPELCSNKEELIKLSEGNFEWEQFIEEVKKVF